MNKTKKIKILHFIYDSPENTWVSGGGVYRTIEIYKNFPSNWEITLYCGGFKKKDKIKKIRNIKFVYSKDSFTYLFSRVYFVLQGNKFFYQNKNKYDLIVNDFSFYSPVLTYKAKNSIVILQNFFGKAFFKKFFIFGFFPFYTEKYLLKKFLYYIFSSNILIERYRMYLNFDKIKYKVIKYAVDDELFRLPKIPDKKCNYILYLGRIEFYQKGLDLLLKVMKSELLKDIKLVIAGSGKDERKLKKRLKNYRNIEYVGRVEGKRKYALLNHCKFVVMPSRYESFGIVALESATVGKPVIGFKGAGLEESVINNKTGILLEKRCVQDFSLAIYNLWKNRKYREKLGLNARQFSKNFQWKKVSKEQLEFYKTVISETKNEKE